jgi:Uma2 family endonuclease
MTAIAPPPIKQQENLADSRSQQLITDQWISATWDEFVKILENPLYAESRCYYDTNQIKQMRIETMPVGSEHADDNTLIIFAISLYCTLKNIPALVKFQPAHLAVVPSSVSMNRLHQIW